jgi:hypothetical protein
MARRSLSLRLTLAGVACALAGATVALAGSAGAAGTTATFSKPLILVGGGAEPSIRIPGDGKSAAIVSAPASLGSNFWRITEKKNKDGSVTFVQSPVQQPDLGTGGGDSEISVGNTPDPVSGCDTIAYSGLHNIDLLDNFTVAKSTDCGKTFSLANPYATQNTLTDRQWQTFDGAKTNFLIYHKVDTSQIVVAESIDGGQTYVSLSQGVNGIVDAATFPNVVGLSQIGNIVTDYSQPLWTNNPLSGEPQHVMYAIFAGPASPADNAQGQIDSNKQSGAYNHNDTIYVGKSTNGGLTWTDTRIFGVAPSTKRELNMLFPVITADKTGNLYAVWSDTYRIQYSVSTNHGATWSKPYQVNTDNRGVAPDPGKADVFPWIAANKTGFLDVVWYHGEGGSPTSNLTYRDPGDANTAWTVAFAQLNRGQHLDKSGAAKPTVLTYSNAVTPVVHFGDVCQNGTFCSLVPFQGAPASTGDRSLLDFFEVAIDKSGRANIALADNADAPGQYIAAYIRQTGGYSATTGQLLPTQKVTQPVLQCSADASFTDPSGDATELVEPTPLPNAPALDILKGYITYAGNAMTLHIKVNDLSQDPPTGATGEQFEYGFAHNKTTYFAVASHDQTQATDAFHMESPLRTTVGGPLTGTFDKATNEVRIVVPSSFFASLSPTVPGFTQGESITGLAITSRRDIANSVVPNADEAAGLCPFVVPSSTTPASAPTVPAPTDDRVLGEHVVLPTTSLPATIPLVASVVLLGAALVTRRVQPQTLGRAGAAAVSRSRPA